MFKTKAKILYDFNPANATQLKINAGEWVNIIDQDIGNGWWKARDKNGNMGLIPASYVEKIDMSQLNISTAVPLRRQGTVKDSDCENSDAEEIPANTERTISPRSPITTKILNIQMPRAFIKTGGEDFLLGQGKTNEVTEAKIKVIMENEFDVCQWHSSNPGQTCKIVSHEKTSVNNGINEYIQYVLKSTYVNGVIKRRYNQFIWLHKVFTEKFPCVVIPPLPAKNANDRFEEKFILFREKKLQKWLTYITKHPVLSNSAVVRHFLTSNDKIKWNAAKRNSESDLYQGAKFFLTVDSPSNRIDWDHNYERLDKVLNFIDSFDRSFRTMQESFVLFNKRQDVCKEFNKIGSAVASVARSMSLSYDIDRSGINLFILLQRSGDTFDKIGKIIDEQSKLDNEFLIENLEEINGSTKEIVSLIDLAKGATTTALCGFQDLTENAENVDKNLRVITRSADAELSWIQNEREVCLRSTMKQYWQNQLDMYTNITTFITETLSKL